MNNVLENQILTAIGGLNKKMDNIQEKLDIIPIMKEELRKISGSVARIEIEHGEKLVILFDAYTVNSEKLDSHEKMINSCEKHIENQDNQIYYLNSKVQGI